MSSNELVKAEVPNNEDNLIPAVFPLTRDPVDYIVSVHIQNLYASYGEQYVKNAITELFLKESTKCPSTTDSK